MIRKDIPENNEDKFNYDMPFTISNYMLSLILPKCVMIYNQIISSTYFQIALNVNKQKNIDDWKKNASWIYYNKMSENTGYNQRVLKETTKILQSLKLINVKKRGKLNIFYLINNDLNSLNDIYEFNKFISNQLLNSLSKIKRKKYQQLFIELEENISLNNKLTNQIKFSNVNLIRKCITNIEQIYKGSSLFFIKNIAPYLNKNNNFKYLKPLSEEERAIFIGSSQSTVSRYINSYINAGFLIIKEGNINKPLKLGLNYKFIEELKNKEKRVVNVNMSDDNFICPICDKGFNDKRSIGVHIAKTKDPQHKLFNKLKKENKCDASKLKELYLEYKNELQNIKNKDDINYLSISCSCKISCKECYNNWKNDFYNNCDHERKIAFEKQYQINSDSPNKITNPPKKIKKKKPVKKKYKINSPTLVKYFYGLTGGVSPNFPKEAKQVKNLLNKNINPEQIKITMDYLHRKGNIDLRFLNRSVNEALMEQTYLQQTKIKETAPYLVKMYYDGMGLPLNMQTFIRDVQKIQETLNSGITFEQAELVIQYMIDIKCPTINFIGSKVTEALTKMKDKKNIKNNPAFFDRDDLTIIKNELINGRTNLRKISDKFKVQAKQMAKIILKENNFSKKFTALEWIWKIGLDLDNELYNIALQYQQNQELTLDKILNDQTISDEQRQTIMKVKQRFESWLNKQHNKFQLTNSQTN
ncbi:MAG: hypothetical protein ACOCP8_00765 [archaeon]